MPACRTQLFSILIAAAVSIPAAWSQESRATVLGRVTDASGAVIQAASITFLNQETGVTARTESNQEGNYTSSFLIPGIYRITAEKTGFKSLVRSRVTLSVNDRVELNLTLEVGSQAESVTVTADASLLGKLQRRRRTRHQLRGSPQPAHPSGRRGQHDPSRQRRRLHR